MHKDINVNVSGPVQPTSTYKTVVLKGNQSFASQVTTPNTKYVIKHDFDLSDGAIVYEGWEIEGMGGNPSIIDGEEYWLTDYESGIAEPTTYNLVDDECFFVINNHISDIKEVTLQQEENAWIATKRRGYHARILSHYDSNAAITIPEGCLLEFDGGSISNGTLVGQNTILIYNQPLNDILTATLEGTWRHESGVKADEEDITDLNGELKFKDKAYIPANYSGLGRKYLRKNLVNGVNTLTQEMVSDANTIYVIQYDFTLGEDITVPANCVLEFNGGSLSNGVLDFLNGYILPEANSFNNVFFKNNLRTKTFYASWFGAHVSLNDNTNQLTNFFNCYNNPEDNTPTTYILDEGTYNITGTILVGDWGHTSNTFPNAQIVSDDWTNYGKNKIIKGAIGVVQCGIKKSTPGILLDCRTRATSLECVNLEFTEQFDSSTLCRMKFYDNDEQLTTQDAFANADAYIKDCTFNEANIGLELWGNELHFNGGVINHCTTGVSLRQYPNLVNHRGEPETINSARFQGIQLHVMNQRKAVFVSNDSDKPVLGIIISDCYVNTGCCLVKGDFKSSEIRNNFVNWIYSNTPLAIGNFKQCVISNNTIGKYDSDWWSLGIIADKIEDCIIENNFIYSLYATFIQAKTIKQTKISGNKVKVYQDGATIDPNYMYSSPFTEYLNHTVPFVFNGSSVAFVYASTEISRTDIFGNTIINNCNRPYCILNTGYELSGTIPGITNNTIIDSYGNILPCKAHVSPTNDSYENRLLCNTLPQALVSGCYFVVYDNGNFDFVPLENIDVLRRDTILSSTIGMAMDTQIGKVILSLRFHQAVASKTTISFSQYYTLREAYRDFDFVERTEELDALVGHMDSALITTAAANYSPEGLESDLLVGKGKWKLPSFGIIDEMIKHRNGLLYIQRMLGVNTSWVHLCSITPYETVLFYKMYSVNAGQSIRAQDCRTSIIVPFVLDFSTVRL